MTRGIARHKARARQTLHRGLAVSAFYKDATLADPIELTARWHTKLQTAGALEGGFDAQIIEGVNRLVFQETELTSEGRALAGLPELPAGVETLELRQGGMVTIPDLDDGKFRLDTLDDPDGPLNIYWNVTAHDA